MIPSPTRRRRPYALPTLLFTFVLSAQAQAQSSTSTRLDPLDPKAQVPSVRYESTLPQSRRNGEDKPVAWREANDTVARIGGWRVYAREAQQPDPAAAEEPAAPTRAGSRSSANASASASSSTGSSGQADALGPIRPQALRSAR